MTERQFSFPRLLVNLSCLLLAAVLLAGCGSRDTSWRKGGVPGSKPYTVRGKTYYPLKSAHGFVEEGVASWYGPGFHGKKTASGERFNQYNISAAHKILPLGTEVRVTNLENHRSLILRINDRGPFVDDRVIDLSRGAAQRLGVIGKGTARVRIQSLRQQQPLERAGGPVGRLPQGRRDDARAACPVSPRLRGGRRRRELACCHPLKCRTGRSLRGTARFLWAWGWQTGRGDGLRGEGAPFGKGSPFPPQTPPILPKTFLLEAWLVPSLSGKDDTAQGLLLRSIGSRRWRQGRLFPAR